MTDTPDRISFPDQWLRWPRAWEVQDIKQPELLLGVEWDIGRALAVLRASHSRRSEPPRRIALMALDFCIDQNEAPTPAMLELLWRSLHLDERNVITADRRARIIEADAAGKTNKVIAAELGFKDTRSVRRLRNEPAYEPPELVIWLGIAARARAGQPPRSDVRDEAARLLGYPNGLTQRQITAVVERSQFAHAIDVEVQRRADGLRSNDAKWVAKKMGIDPRVVEGFMKRPYWERELDRAQGWPSQREWVVTNEVERHPATGKLRFVVRPGRGGRS